MRSDHIPIVIFSICYIILFGLFGLFKQNYEFMIYILVILILFILIFIYINRVSLSSKILWALSIWGLLHLMGGNIFINGVRLYDVQLIPIVLRFDQLIHAYGFCVATIVSFQLLQPFLKTNIKKWVLLSFLIVMIGMGLGALNEVVELMAVVLLKVEGPGGYFNNAFDLVFNLIGCIIALFFIHFGRKT